MRIRRTASVFPMLLAAAALMPLQAATLLVANKSDDTVDLFDLASGKSTATLPTGEAPHEVSVSPDGKLAVVSNYGGRDRAGSTLTVRIFSGVEAATSSMSMPPSEDPMKVMRLLDRSTNTIR